MAVKQYTLKLKDFILSKATERSLIKAIKESGKFDSEFYLKTNADVNSHPKWSRNPVLHFVRYGSSEGRAPSSWFDPAYYLLQNPDVKEQGVNPLVHYILHGRREGRKPNAKQQKIYAEDTVEWIRYSIVNHLWGGYSEAALKDLEVIYLDEEKDYDLRYFAAWQAARWFYFIDDYKRALELSHIIDGMGEQYRLGKVAVMNKAYCQMHLGMNEEAQETLTEYLEKKPDDADILLSLSNLCESENDRLEKINSAFSIHGYASVYRIDDSKPLSFSNIYAKAPAASSEQKVSVIIPTYMSQDRLGIAIQSLLNQSWQNLEIIVVDDCSPDDTYQVAQEFAKKDPRVIPIRQEKNGGAYRARNRGLQHASGDFITTHDGDDWSHPQKIESQMRFLACNPKVKGVCTHWTRALENLKFSHNWRLNPRLIHWSHSSFLFRREILEELGYWDSVVVGGDTEFIWRVQSKYGKWSVKNILSAVPMAFALDDDGSLTRTKSTHVKTIHNGLRHIYRSTCEWWHKQTDNYYVDNTENRNFNTPQTMVTRGHNDLQCDVLFVADFSELHANNKFYRLINQHLDNGRKVALYHWPIYGTFRDNFDKRYFEILENEDAVPIVYGMNVEADKVYISSWRILQEHMDNVAAIKVQEANVVVADSQEFPMELIEKRTKEYFSVTPRFMEIGNE